MKRILATAVFCCLSMIALAQAKFVRVVNNTPCTVYYALVGSNAPGCVPAFSSTVLAQAGPSVMSYSTTTIPGWPAAPPDHYIVGAKILNGPAACATVTGAVGEPCSGFPPAFGYAALNPVCSFCKQVQAVWTPAAAGGGTAILTFN